mmetsp:Transcript_25334/g.45687  ORF Transcript_25334/g.45687 Transcript_25334/m.45687 type:complete len:224 (+) Transcript_25334:1538-2209(+)
MRACSASLSASNFSPAATASLSFSKRSRFSSYSNLSNSALFAASSTNLSFSSRSASALASANLRVCSSILCAASSLAFCSRSNLSSSAFLAASASASAALALSALFLASSTLWISSSLILASILSFVLVSSHSNTSAMAVVVMELIRCEAERPPSLLKLSFLMGTGIWRLRKAASLCRRSMLDRETLSREEKDETEEASLTMLFISGAEIKVVLLSARGQKPF